MLRTARLSGLGWKLCRSLSCSRDTSEKKKPTADNYLGDPESAIRGKTSWEVFRGWVVFKVLSYDLVVDNSTKVSVQGQLQGKSKGVPVSGRYLGTFFIVANF